MRSVGTCLLEIPVFRVCGTSHSLILYGLGPPSLLPTSFPSSSYITSLFICIVTHSLPSLSLMALEVEALNSPSSAVPLLHHEEDTDDHQSWTKGKRIKRSRLDGNIPPAEEEYFALCLLMLAQGGKRGAVDTHCPTSPPPPPAACNGYVCSVCHRTFPSYQALGGHKGSHKSKLVTEDHQTAGTTPQPGAHPQGAAMTRKSASVNSTSHATRTHQCSICLKTFASGQALGGHKRRHFEGTGGSNSLASTEAMVLSLQGHRSFDLNLPASPEHSPEANCIDLGTKSQLSGDRKIVGAHRAGGSSGRSGGRMIASCS